jgi:F-type H+-transporting ATPase subunit delta
MAELTTVARPYAEAMFRTAKEQGKLDDYATMLASMAAVASDAQMADTLANPRFSLDTKLDLFASVLGAQLDPTGRNLASMLIDSRRSSLLVPIAQLYESLKREHQATLKAVITSAFALSDAEVRSLVDALAAKHGKKVVVEVRVDADLIGGVRIQIGDEVLSASVRDQLNHMAAAIMS